MCVISPKRSQRKNLKQFSPNSLAFRKSVLQETKIGRQNDYPFVLIIYRQRIAFVDYADDSSASFAMNSTRGLRLSGSTKGISKYQHFFINFL